MKASRFSDAQKAVVQDSSKEFQNVQHASTMTRFPPNSSGMRFLVGQHVEGARRGHADKSLPALRVGRLISFPVPSISFPVILKVFPDKFLREAACKPLNLLRDRRPESWIPSIFVIFPCKFPV